MLAFQANVSDFNPAAFEEALIQQYALRTIQRKLDMDCFRYTYHHDPCSIYFNSVLLANIMQQSSSASDDVRRTRTNDRETAPDTTLTAGKRKLGKETSQHPEKSRGGYRRCAAVQTMTTSRCICKPRDLFRLGGATARDSSEHAEAAPTELAQPGKHAKKSPSCAQSDILPTLTLAVKEEFRPPYTAEQVRHQLVLFVTVKLLHGLFHLLQPASSPQLTLRSAPPPIL
jgi:hypothetical protein